MTVDHRGGPVAGLLARNAAVLGVGSVVLVLSVLAYVRVPLLPFIGHDLSMSAADLGLVTTVYAVGRLCADIPAGRLSDLRAVGWMLGAASLLVGGSSLVLAAADVSGVVLAAFFLLGVSSAVVNTTGMVYFAEAATLERRGRSMAGFSAALLGGQALGPAVGGALAAAWGWRTALVASAVVAAVVGLTVVFRTLLRGSGARRDPDPEAPTPASRLPRREQAIFYFVPFAAFFTLGSMPQTLIPIIGADEFGLTVGVVGLVLGIGGGCRFVGALVGGVVSDKVSRKAALVPALTVQAAGVALLAFEDSLGAWVSALVLMSLASFPSAVAATMLVDRSHGRGSGKRLGPFRFAGDLGLIAGPATVSLVYERLGQRPAALVVCGVLLSAALASAVGVRETRWAGSDRSGRRLLSGAGEEP